MSRPMPDVAPVIRTARPSGSILRSWAPSRGSPGVGARMRDRTAAKGDTPLGVRCGAAVRVHGGLRVYGWFGKIESHTLVATDFTPSTCRRPVLGEQRGGWLGDHHPSGGGTLRSRRHKPRNSSAPPPFCYHFSLDCDAEGVPFPGRSPGIASKDYPWHTRTETLHRWRHRRPEGALHLTFLGLTLAVLAACDGQGTPEEVRAADSPRPSPPSPRTIETRTPDRQPRPGPDAALPWTWVSSAMTRDPQTHPSRSSRSATSGAGIAGSSTRRLFPISRRNSSRPGSVQWKFVPFVLGMFPNGDKAALAAECAGAQGPDAFQRMRGTVVRRPGGMEGHPGPDGIFRPTGRGRRACEKGSSPSAW